MFSWMCVWQPTVAWPQRDSIPEGYPESLRKDLTSLFVKQAHNPDDIHVLLALSEVHLSMGDDLLTKKNERLSAYEMGVKYAQQALAIQPENAEAHFLYAANLGNATQIKGYAAGMMNVGEILSHVRTALALAPNHAPAHQMLGGLLAELPWMLGGDVEDAQAHLEKAIAIDEQYTNARILLAKLFIKQDKLQAARDQLLAVIHAPTPHYPYTWKNQFLPEAQALLKTIADH